MVTCTITPVRAAVRLNSGVRRRTDNTMTEILAIAVVVIVGLYFIALGATALLAPAISKRFLLGFASSPLTHYLELAVRLIVGGALLVQSPRMYFSPLFELFGWVLVVTTACLLLIPWQWHHRFARYAVPKAIRYITLIGLSSIVLGTVVVFAVVRGAAV